MTYGTKSYEALAGGTDRAHAGFVQALIDIAGISENEAVAVKNLYLKNKLAKSDAIMGRITVKHGAYLDREVILRAVEMAR